MQINLDEDTVEFNKWLDSIYGEIEICGKSFLASEILPVFDMERYNKNFIQFLKEARNDYDTRN